MIMNQKFVLSPGYISGLTQTDGSFFCSIILSSKHRFGLQFRPKFTITADLDSKYVLDSIQLYFGCGNVIINNKNYTAELVVERLEDLQKKIIPHFTNYTVFCAKLHAFNLFTQIVNILINKEKRTLEGRRELLKLALSMNSTNNRTEERLNVLYNQLGITEEKYKELIPISIKEVDSNFLTNAHISGIIDGDGSFFISFKKNGIIKTGFNITNDKHSRPLLEKIQSKFLGIGSINEGTKNELVYTITGLNQIVDILIPFINENPLYSERSLHYEKFRKVSMLLKNESPLRFESKLEIVDLCYNMNKNGKHRLYSKAEYIELLEKSYTK
jgi:hypothetical protein